MRTMRTLRTRWTIAAVGAVGSVGGIGLGRGIRTRPPQGWQEVQGSSLSPVGQLHRVGVDGAHGVTVQSVAHFQPAVAQQGLPALAAVLTDGDQAFGLARRVAVAGSGQPFRPAAGQQRRRRRGTGGVGRRDQGSHRVGPGLCIHTGHEPGQGNAGAPGLSAVAGPHDAAPQRGSGLSTCAFSVSWMAGQPLLSKVSCDHCKASAWRSIWVKSMCSSS